MRLVQEDPNGAGHYRPTPEYSIYIEETYGTAIQFERDLDGAVLTSKMIFATDAVRQQYNADPAVIEHLRLRNEHNAANGIISRTHFE